MARLLFRPVPVAGAVTVRFDTASGSSTPADVRSPGGGGVVITGSVLVSDPGSGALPLILGPDGVSVLYQKTLDYRGVVVGSPVALTGAVMGGGLPFDAGVTFTAGRPAGLVVPRDHGVNAKARLVAGGPLHVAVYGDSVEQGAYASSLRTGSGPALLSAWLQTRLGDGGSGFFGTMNTDLALTALSMGAAARTSYAAAGDFWTLSGTWTAQQGTGPGWQGIRSAASGTTATAPAGAIRGRFIDIFVRSNTTAAFTYSIDGATAVAGSVAGVQTITVDTGSAASATHTLVLTHTDTNILDFYGVRGRNTSGVYVDNYSTYGAKTAAMNNSSGVAVASYSAGSNDTQKADMLLYCLGANDVNSAVAVDTSLTNIKVAMDSVIDTIYGGTAAACDIAFVIPHIGKFDNATPQWASFVARVTSLANSYGAAVVNLWTAGGCSWQAMNAASRWGNATTVGTAGTDSIHLADAGHAWWRDRVSELFLANSIV